MNRIFLRIGLGTALFLSTATAFAGSYDIKTMTPEIQQALSGRQNRYSDLQNLKSQGAIGENKSGYVEILNSAPGGAATVNQENEDRRTLYRGIVDQNNLGAQGMSEVERVFAEVQRDKARPGDFIQSPSGQWTQK